jgi:hypothetical protein
VPTGLFTVTTVVAVPEQPFRSVTTRVKVPALAEVTGNNETILTGLAEANPPGPVHEYSVKPEGPPVNQSVDPTQTGSGEWVAVATGLALIVTVVVIAVDVQVPLYTNNV